MKHFASMELFNATKVAANPENTKYTQNGAVSDGAPEILWADFVLIHDVGGVWNRGRYYNSSKYLMKLASMAKDAYMPWDKTIITIVDKSFAELASKMQAYEDYPGILPSIVVAPQLAEANMDSVIALVDKGCDVLSTAYENVSVYNASADDAENYAEIQNDMTQVIQFFIERGIFTNCYKYPDASKASLEASYIAKYEEFGLVENISDGTNGYKQDNMLLQGLSVTSATQAVDFIDAHINENSWLILVTDSSALSASDITSIVDAISTYIDDGSAIYLQMNEAADMRASSFNIARASELPFKVYKDGEVDAKLSEASQSSFDFSYTSPEYKDDLMSYTASNFKHYTQLLLEDGSHIATENYELIEYTGLGTILISEQTLRFENTDDDKWKTPMLSYVHNNTSYTSFGGVFLNELATYMYDKLKEDFMKYNAENLMTYMGTYMNTYFMLIDRPG